MAEMAKNVLLTLGHASCYELLSWLNETSGTRSVCETLCGFYLPDGSSHQKLEIIVKMEGKPVTEPRQETPTENSGRSTEVVVLISEDEEDEERLKKVDQETQSMETEQSQRVQTAERAEAVAQKEGEAPGFHGDTLLPFIRKYCHDSNINTFLSGPSLPSTLSPGYHKDIIQTCYQAPYCLYLYVGVDLGGGRTTGVILIGYAEQRSGISVVKLLLTLQMSVDTADPDADALLLMEALKNLGLPLSNLVAFYCDAPHPEVTRVFVSQLQVFSPRLVSLCGLPGVAGRACQAGLLASFNCVVDLIRDIHRHFSACSSTHDGLRELFESYSPSDPISAQCLIIIDTVQKMVHSWRLLVEYFKSASGTEGAACITARLMDHKVKLYFLFLSQTLGPLRDLQQCSSMNVAQELQLASILLHTYTASVLRPSVAERFLRRRNERLLFRENAVLPAEDVDIGSSARDFLWASAVVDLGEQERSDFLKDAVTFYRAALQSLLQSIPKHLGDVALMNISKVLKHPENIQDWLPGHTLTELAVQLGVCDAGSPQTQQLTAEYYRVIETVEEEQTRGGRGGHCWSKLLHGIRQSSVLHRFLLTLLALPSSLCRTQVFAKVFSSTGGLLDTPPVQRKRPQRPRICRRRPPDPQRFRGKREDEEGEESSSENPDDVAAKLRPHIPSKCNGEDSDHTEDSSGETPPQAEIVYVVSSDDDDDGDDDDCLDSTSTPMDSSQVQGVVGELVWGQLEAFAHWPAITIPCTGKAQPPGKTMVEWYGQRMSSLISSQNVKPFAAFSQHFSTNSFAVLVTYREAIFLSLQEAARRCGKQFPAFQEDKDELLKQMLDWALGGFQPTGSDRLKPAAATNSVSKTHHRPKVKKQLFQKANAPPQSAPPQSFSSSTPTSRKGRKTREEGCDLVGKFTKELTKEKNRRGGERWAAKKQLKGGWEGEKDDWGAAGGGGWEKGKAGWGRGGWRGRKVQRKKSSLMDGFENDVSPDYVPNKKRTYCRTYSKVMAPSSVYTQPDQNRREEMIREIMNMKLDIEGFCLCCGTEDVQIFHPLFKGSLCSMCKDNFTDTLYRYDEDGYQSYCTICCYGLEVILCGNDSCCRSYCDDCLNILVGKGTFDSLKLLDPWICYLCQPHRPHGALEPREDWSIRVQELFANNSAMAFEPHRVYPSIPANLRKPVRVLSLFDGIATGYLVLKDLGFKVEKYVASEVCDDSIAVATVNHDGKIIHVGDARFITQEHIERWGPFDLLIGGSPCNDLSIVNPIRKGLYEGTGRLFFEFYRILELLKPSEEESRPFFWLFENVVFMNTHDKVNICRFLECNPVLVDAVKVSPAHRARYFWGNIPGMSRPIIASQNDKLSLQDCLEIGREARVTKVRTITTNKNSLKQGKDVSLLPVLHNGREDNIWITELEKIFGFPKHYTDVRDMNRKQRQKVLGKAWSVPVIRHLFAPLKDYFACEELPPLTSSTSPSSPASPEL